MVNRVFDPEATIEVGGEPGEAPRPEPHRQTLAPVDPSARSTSRSGAQARPPEPEAGSRRHDQSWLLITAFFGICLVSAASSIFYVSHWNRLQQSLSQERNLLLVERLRNLGPATATPLTGPEPAAPTLPQPSLAPSTTAGSSSADGLPPPPPEEPWMQQLSTLPHSGPEATGRPAPGLLRVPVSPQVTVSPVAALPTSAAPGRPTGGNAPLPQLVGVVGAAGKPASAIFLVSGTSMSVGSGETIGSSGWKLRSANGETALIERGGEIRQVSIINGF